MCPINQQTQQQQRTNGAQQHQRRSSDCSVIVTARSNRQHQQHYVQRPVPPPQPPSVPQSTGAIWSSSSVVEPRTNISNSSFDAACSAIHVSDQPRENIHTHTCTHKHTHKLRGIVATCSLQFSSVLWSLFSVFCIIHYFID